MKLQALSLIAPFDRLYDAPVPGKIFALFGACYMYLINDVFSTALLLIVASGALDMLLGMRAAKISDTYNASRAHAGLVSKIAGVGLMMLVRGLEAWLMKQGVVDTRGMIAAGLTLSLFAVDLESIQAKREEMGAAPIPALGALTKWLNGFLSKQLPEVHSHSRSTDPPVDK